MLPYLKHTRELNQEETKKLNNQKGQSMVEFILLMTIIMLISLGYLRVVGGGVSEYWLGMAQVILDDKNQTLELR